MLMTGVSLHSPFVAAGGLLIALSFLLGGYEDRRAVRRHRRGTALHSTLPDAQALGLRPRALPQRQQQLADLCAYISALFFIIRQDRVRPFIPALAGCRLLPDRHDRPASWASSLVARREPVRRANSADPAVSLPATGFPGVPSSAASSPGSSPTGSGWKVPDLYRRLMPLLIHASTGVTAGLLMLIVFGKPIGWLMDQLRLSLNSLGNAQQSSSASSSA